MAVRVVAAVGVLLAGSCAHEPAPPLAGDGELVLELGRGYRPLADSLQARGVKLLPRCDYQQEPRAALAAPSADPEPQETQAAAPSDDAAGVAPAGAPGDEVPPPAVAPESAAKAAGWFEVELMPRQTLFLLAKKHLGSANRFKEILELNGWSDADARRLRPGQKVRIPKPAS